MLVVHFPLVMLMAGGAGEFSIVSWIRVALRAVIPFPLMLPRINRKKLSIVGAKICRTPAGTKVVALLAVG
jgi:hypothetical protein